MFLIQLVAWPFEIVAIHRSLDGLPANISDKRQAKGSILVRIPLKARDLELRLRPYGWRTEYSDCMETALAHYWLGRFAVHAASTTR
ncbi:hypothetical protein WT71_19855 [Burkholderia stagnalis]|nr:hypothetical protein WT71_19855 [Burkholderia stagnalis]